MSWPGREDNEGLSQAVHRVEHGRAVPRVTKVRVRRSLTRGKPTRCTGLLWHHRVVTYLHASTRTDPANAVRSV
jgi:hypothetical protein